MDTNSKTGNLNRSGNTSVQRLTPSELRERLFQEQEARIAELVRHNAELTKAMEHEREQSRLHAGANAKALELLAARMQEPPSSSGTILPIVNIVTSTTANMIAPGLVAALSFLYVAGKSWSPYKYPMLTTLLRWEWGVMAAMLSLFFTWAFWAGKTNNVREDVAEGFQGLLGAVALIFVLWMTYIRYCYHCLETSTYDDTFNVVGPVVIAFFIYGNGRKAWQLWKRRKRATSQNKLGRS